MATVGHISTRGLLAVTRKLPRSSQNVRVIQARKCAQKIQCQSFFPLAATCQNRHDIGNATGRKQVLCPKPWINLHPLLQPRPNCTSKTFNQSFICHILLDFGLCACTLGASVQAPVIALFDHLILKYNNLVTNTLSIHCV